MRAREPLARLPVPCTCSCLCSRPWSSENWRRCSCRRRRLDRHARRGHGRLARAEPGQPVERPPALERRAHRPSVPACDEREGARARGSTREAAHESRRQCEREGARADFCTRFLSRRSHLFLSLSSDVRAESKRESTGESEGARERGSTGRGQRERGGTREREGQQEGGSAACAWGSCRGASFCSGAC